MPMYPSGHEDSDVAAVIFLLDDWLNAIETGTAHLRLPDHNYQRSGDRPKWTEKELDTLIRDIDAEIDQEVTRAPGASVGAKAGPAFHRLAVPQRLCLAQQLDSLLEKQRENWEREKEEEWLRLEPAAEEQRLVLEAIRRQQAATDQWLKEQQRVLERRERKRQLDGLLNAAVLGIVVGLALVILIYVAWTPVSQLWDILQHFQGG